MHASGFSVLSFMSSKPVGKVRRRVQDLRVPSSSYVDVVASRPTPDLSHNESERLAADSLLSQGLEDYQKVLDMEGEVDFLSELEKKYILRNAVTVDSDASDGDDEELRSLSTDSPTWCATASTDDGSLVAGLDLNSINDVKWDPDQDELGVKVYFQSDNTAASMKDLVREFIRKAVTAVVIVTDSFSDVELLFDLLEVSRKRNVSVHLLLDRLNLSLFTCTWQELKLCSTHFPKLSVCSVHGRTYCAKTGRKLTGQLCQNFIITDWTEVLTGSYSLSWLSWHVHRSLAVLLKGGAVAPFRQEFLRLYSRSNPVPGFVTLPLYTTSHAAPDSPHGITSPQSKQDRLCRWVWTKEGGTLEIRDAQTKAKIPASLSKPPSAEFWTEEPGCSNTQDPHRGKTDVDPEAQNQIQTRIQSRPGQHFPNIRSQLAALSFGPTAEKTAQESNPLFAASPGLTKSPSQSRTPYEAVRHQSTVNTSQNLGVADRHAGLFFQRQRTYPGMGKGGQLNHMGNFPPKVSLLSHHSKGTPPPSPQEKPGPLWLFPRTNRHPCGREDAESSLRTRKQDQAFRPLLQSQPSYESPRSPPPSAAGTRLKLQLFSPGPGTSARASLQATSPPNPNWMSRSRTRIPVDPHKRLLAAYSTGQCGRTPFYSGITTALRNTTYRHPGSLQGPGPGPKMT